MHVMHVIKLFSAKSNLGDVTEQKFKYGPIRILETTDIRLLDELCAIDHNMTSRIVLIA